MWFGLFWLSFSSLISNKIIQLRWIRTSRWPFNSTSSANLTVRKNFIKISENINTNMWRRTTLLKPYCLIGYNWSIVFWNITAKEEIKSYNKNLNIFCCGMTFIFSRYWVYGSWIVWKTQSIIICSNYLILITLSHAFPTKLKPSVRITFHKIVYLLELLSMDDIFYYSFIWHY